MIIDTQTHFISRHALAALTRLQAQGWPWPAGLTARTMADDSICNLDSRLEDMDRHGVDVSVLSFVPVGLLAYDAQAAELCRIANDGLLEACAARPDRFVMLGTLPLPDCAAASTELERLAREPAARGVMFVAQATLYRPEQIGLEAVLARAAAHGMAVVIHPSAGVGDLGEPFRGFGLESALQAMVSHAVVAARMIHAGMLDRLPDLDLILTHAGGVLPSIVERLDSRGRGEALHRCSHYLRHRIFYDLCGISAAPALRFVCDTLGAARLMMGSDWPSRPLGDAIDAARLAPLNDAEMAGLLGGTASRWFLPERARNPSSMAPGASP